MDLEIFLGEAHRDESHCVAAEDECAKLGSGGRRSSFREREEAKMHELLGEIFSFRKRRRFDHPRGSYRSGAVANYISHFLLISTRSLTRRDSGSDEKWTAPEPACLPTCLLV